MEPLFALDIGTRTVVGLLMEKNGEGYEILASARTEHRQRAMYDGQVHDVEEVAQAVRIVKAELEQKSGYALTRVAVAAAGRALKTEVASALRQESLPVRWEKEPVLALEMEAVEHALRQISATADEASLSYHCVGYSVIERWLEGQEIASLIGQRGRDAKVSVIATFLPRMVIDGLVAVLGRVGLEMESLTLEPIAAGQAAIPANMRRLNLALVDIGAGTADIALTKNGSFFAYGMVPMAGDEITEGICGHYLLDFQIGEKIKRELAHKTQLSFKDFFGMKITLAQEEILNIISPIVRKLAEQIAGSILDLNRGVPQAVILIGGGSLTPLLPQLLAERIGLPPARVGIQVRERISGVLGEKGVKGPEGITPVGIGISALEEQGLHYYSVTVNDALVPIFELQLATVAEALLAAGIQPRSFLGRPGRALTFELNGEMRIVKGTLGQAAQLTVNGRSARLEETIKPGDDVSFIPGTDGEDARTKIIDILTFPEGKKISWNGQEEEFLPSVLVDGNKAVPLDEITDGSKLTYLENEDLEDLLQQKGLALGPAQSLTIKVNGQSKTLTPMREIKVNGEIVQENCGLKSGDRIEVIEKPIPVKEAGLQAVPLIFHVNGQEVVYPPQGFDVRWRGREVSLEEAIVDGMDLRVEGFKTMPILSELLPYVTIPDHAPATRLVLTVNGQEAEFTTKLHPGDRVTVSWS
ncbi:cell division FtsA domain-containing protein [Paradesulfitobacterium aromaticivorans]